MYKILGFESSVQANKIIHKESKWYGDGLRHIVKPYINYEYSDFSSSTNLIFQHDQIDILNDSINKIDCLYNPLSENWYHLMY